MLTLGGFLSRRLLKCPWHYETAGWPIFIYDTPDVLAY